MAPKHSDSRSPREIRLFRDDSGQAVRIPADFEFSSDRVLMRREGNRLVLEPVRRQNLVEVLARLAPLGPADAFPDVDDTLLPAEGVDL